MSDSQDNNVNNPQITQTKPDTSPKRPPKILSQRQREGQSWLRQLRLLPPDTLEGCIRRLPYGVIAEDAALWPDHPDPATVRLQRQSADAANAALVSLARRA